MPPASPVPGWASGEVCTESTATRRGAGRPATLDLGAGRPATLDLGAGRPATLDLGAGRPATLDLGAGRPATLDPCRSVARRTQTCLHLGAIAEIDTRVVKGGCGPWTTTSPRACNCAAKLRVWPCWNTVLAQGR